MLKYANIVPSCALTVLNCVKVYQSLLNCAQLCQIIKINLFSVAKSFLCYTVPKCAKTCRSVPICAKPVQNVRNLPSYAYFGTVLRSLIYFGTDLYSSTHFSTLQHKSFSARVYIEIFCTSENAHDIYCILM